METVLKGLKNDKDPGADSVINEFLKYGGSEIRNKLLKIMNMIFERGEVLNDFRKTSVKLLYSLRKVIRVSIVIIKTLVWSL